MGKANDGTPDQDIVRTPIGFTTPVTGSLQMMECDPEGFQVVFGVAISVKGHFRNYIPKTCAFYGYGKI